LSEIDSRLLSVFEPEQQEHLARIRALIEGPGGVPVWDELLRRAHTLKGAARAVGITSIEELAHRLESLFARVREGRATLDAAARELVLRSAEKAEDILAAVLRTGREPEAPGALQPAPARPEPRPEVVRVEAESVDRLVRTSSQLLAAATAAAQATHGLAGLYERVVEMEREWERLRLAAATALRGVEQKPEFAPVREGIDAVDSRMHGLAAETRKRYAAQRRHAWRVEGLSAELHRDACRARMVPAAGIFDGFRKMVRDLAGEAGKEIDFRLEGGDLFADRLVLQVLKDPVMHLLRNAIAHGLEPAGERQEAGKPRQGLLRLALETRGDRLLLAVEDDGRGIDSGRIVAAARRAGLLDVVETPAAGELYSILFHPGFSTSEDVTSLSGRGMGLSVVQEAVSGLQGQVWGEPRPGGGTVFRVSVPLTVSTHHLVLLRVGAHRFAIPGRGIRKLLRFGPQAIETLEGKETVRAMGRPVPLARLADVLGLAETSVAQPVAVFYAVVLGVGRESLVLVVDALLDEREAIVKDLGLPARSAGFSSGGILLEDGGVAVVLDPSRLMQAFQASGARPAIKPAPALDAARPSTILVVDDSITTRALEKSILEAHGYRVRIAVDGLDALNQLRAELPDLVIADVSMPRMDGFQLLEAIKQEERTASVPVIMVTSMESRVDQERGLALGADAYIIKRKFDQRDLLETVRQIL